MMNQQFSRQQVIAKWNACAEPWPPTVRDKIQHARGNARRHQITHTTVTLGRVGGYIVDLARRKCGCGIFQNTNLHCEHAVAYIWDVE
jgi:hypothetical protein